VARVGSRREAPEARRWLLLSRKERGAREDDPALLLASLRALTAEFRGDPEFPFWAADLAERDKAAGQALSDAARVAAGRWASDESLGEHGLVPGDEFAALASLFENLGREHDSRAAWSAAAQAFGEQAARSRLSTARGANLERAYCLLQAGRADEALKLYDAMAAAYPDEFTFQYGYARALHELKRSEDALIRARKAAASGYGDNWLRAVALEAKILSGLGRKEEAAKAIDSALAEAAAPKSVAVRTHRYLAELRKLRAAL
jgi:tetratricopeptide (TPR) repeat protein